MNKQPLTECLLEARLVCMIDFEPIRSEKGSELFVSLTGKKYTLSQVMAMCVSKNCKEFETIDTTLFIR